MFKGVSVKKTGGERVLVFFAAVSEAMVLGRFRRFVY